MSVGNQHRVSATFEATDDLLWHGASHRPTAAVAAGIDARVRVRAGGSFHDDLRGVAEQSNAPEFTSRIAAAVAHSRGHLGRGIRDAPD
jgi:hypothetical protein